MTDISLDEALAILAATVEQARSNDIPIAATVLDRAGLQIAAQRMDGVFPCANELAARKAFGALNLRVPTHLAAGSFPEAVQRSLVAAEPRVTFLHGGFPVTRDGAVVGALGVTGGSGEQDIACCEAGLKAFVALSSAP